MPIYKGLILYSPRVLFKIYFLGGIHGHGRNLEIFLWVHLMPTGILMLQSFQPE